MTLGVTERRQFTRVLVDAGPLVAINRRDDQHHKRCVETLQQIAPPMLTSWLVIAEAAHLLRDSVSAVERLLSSPQLGILEILPLTHDDLSALVALVRKYQSLGPQLADVSLVHLAGRESLQTVFTLDRRDFMIYRTATGKPLQLLPEST